MVVEFSQAFLKEMKKHFSKAEAKKTLKKLATTSPADGDLISLVSHIALREKRLKSFRFYFIVDSERKHVLTRKELEAFLVKFIALSKKNNQQAVIDKLKEDLRKHGF